MSTEHERLRVLLAEDDPVLRVELADLLRLEGYEVDEAGNGAVALEKALLGRPDVVVTDYYMPVSLGGSLIESLRGYLRPPPAVVVITGFSSAAEWCAQNGVRTFLWKPFRGETLVEAVAHAARRRVEGAPPSASGIALGQVRGGCVVVVGDAAKGLMEALPPSLRHARVVVLDSVEDALAALDDVLPDLVVVCDGPENDVIQEKALERNVPCLVRTAPLRTPLPSIAAPKRTISGEYRYVDPAARRARH